MVMIMLGDILTKTVLLVLFALCSLAQILLNFLNAYMKYLSKSFLW